MKTMPETVTYNLEAGIFNWELAPGKTIEAWGYNNQMAGPVIRAKKGDTLVVRLKNNLVEPTTIHWHGLRVPAGMDGTEEVQKPVAPGESFEYRFELPDAGTFWYHPHTNETVQMERGLYGAIVVEGDDEPVFDADRVLLLDDVKLDRQNRFTKPSWFLPRWLERHNGREGNILIVNGKERPELTINAGQTERWRIVNVANARYMKLSFGGRLFKIIGTDGGLLERPVTATQILLSPGERVDIAVGPFREGETFKLESLPYDRGTGRSKKMAFATVKVAAAKPSVSNMPERLRMIEPLAPAGAEPNRFVKLHGKRNWKDGVDFTINDEMHLHDHEPVKVGELQIWEISNPSMMAHPFHLHGFFFQVLSVDGETPAYRAWKDTVNVPKGSTVKIAWIADDRPGMWMYHCHILEHAAAGMMAHFEVVRDEAEKYPADKQSPVFTAHKH